MSLHPYVPAPLCLRPYVFALMSSPLCLRPYVLRPYVLRPFVCALLSAPLCRVSRADAVRQIPIYTARKIVSAKARL